MFRTGLLFLVPLLRASCVFAQKICYWSDGTPADGYSACNNATEHSGCCRTYQVPSNLPVDLCTNNGLCLARNGVWNGFFFQSACTDQTWQSSFCPQACPALGTPSSSIVQPCNASSGGLWCCRADGTGDCCARSKVINVGQLIIPTSIYPIPPQSSTISSATSSTASSTIESTPQTTSSCANTTIPEPRPRVTTATIGVGVSLGVAFLATLALLVWREAAWRKRSSTVPLVKEEAEGNNNNNNPDDKPNDDMRQVVEIPMYHELERDGHGYHEMGRDGHNYHEMSGYHEMGTPVQY